MKLKFRKKTSIRAYEHITNSLRAGLDSATQDLTPQKSR